MDLKKTVKIPPLNLETNSNPIVETESNKVIQKDNDSGYSSSSADSNELKDEEVSSESSLYSDEEPSKVKSIKVDLSKSKNQKEDSKLPKITIIKNKPNPNLDENNDLKSLSMDVDSEKTFSEPDDDLKIETKVILSDGKLPSETLKTLNDKDSSSHKSSSHSKLKSTLNNHQSSHHSHQYSSKSQINEYTTDESSSHSKSKPDNSKPLNRIESELSSLTKYESSSESKEVEKVVLKAPQTKFKQTSVVNQPSVSKSSPVEGQSSKKDSTNLKIKLGDKPVVYESVLTDVEYREIYDKLDANGNLNALNNYIICQDEAKRRGEDVTKVIINSINNFVNNPELCNYGIENEIGLMTAAYICRQSASNKINHFTTKNNIKTLLKRDFISRNKKGNTIVKELTQEKIKERANLIRGILKIKDKKNPNVDLSSAIEIFNSIEKSLVNNRSLKINI
ncbi:MAG: hypothetical protein LBC92_02770 [Rickettsiales bacterium]|jgi:hypothetical protein|nr:hypothetical protein [Rickettsiales bacterium]